MIVQRRAFFEEHWFKELLNSFEESIDSIVITSPSPEEHFLYVNEAFKKKTLYTESELVGLSPRILQGAQTNRLVLDELKAALKAGKNFIGQNTNYRKNGSSYIVHWYISALKNPKGETVAYISYQKEITQAVWEHNQLKLLSSVVDQVNQMVVVTDLQGVVVYVNSYFLKKYGFSEDEVLHRSIDFLQSGKQSQSFYKDLWLTILKGDSFHATFINKNSNGEHIFEQKTITPLKNSEGDVEFFVSVGQDISKIMSDSNDFQKKAYRDSLTGLYNRLKLDETIERKWSKLNKKKSPLSMILLDIDNFKSINDTLGHDKGDEVLKNLANLLQKAVRKNDLIVRWGGEEFMVLIEEPLTIAAKIAEKIRYNIEHSLCTQDRIVTVSLGASQLREDDTPELLFKRIDEALYRSKKEGKNRLTLA